MTFYHFSRFMQIWILPPNLNLLLMVIGLLIHRYLEVVGKILIIIAIISLWLFSTPIIAQFLINQLQYQYPPLHIDQVVKKNSAAIVVLGGGHSIYPKSKTGYILSSATEFRLRYAAHLYHHTHFPIITSGGKLNTLSPSEAELMRIEMENYFKTPVAWKENKSRNTKDEGNYILPILEKHNIKMIYLVTNAWHMPRAMYTFNYSFKHTDIKIIAAPMGYSLLQTENGVLNYLPSLKGLNISVIALHEYLGMVAYHLDNLI